MKIEVIRYAHGLNSTVGLLTVDGLWRCYTCEDQRQTSKVYGETRIPDGTYDIVVRATGGMAARYRERFPHEHHPGMLWLLDVPDFEWVYIHIGNDHTHTDGCILVGKTVHMTSDGGGTVGQSAAAYIELYREVLAAIERQERVSITVRSL
jgi:hypothetical protein